MEVYATHTTLLRRAVDITDGSILECGGGKHSTPIVHEAARRGRRVVTYDTDAQWLAYLERFSVGRHHVLPTPLCLNGMPDWNMLPYQDGWDLVFVDQHPAAGRLVTLSAMSRTQAVVVLHDTECPTYFFEPVLQAYRFRYDDARHPRTSVVTNRPGVVELFQGC